MGFAQPGRVIACATGQCPATTRCLSLSIVHPVAAKPRRRIPERRKTWENADHSNGDIPMVASSRILNAIAILLILASPTMAAPTAPAWLPVRVSDGVKGSNCIDRSKESISIRLMRLVVDRQAVWFADNQKVDILLNITMSGRTAAGRRTISMPRAYASSFKAAPMGMLTLDSELAPFGRYKLVDIDRVSHVRIEIFLSNEADNAALSDVVLGVADGTKLGPVPANPLTRVTDRMASDIVRRIAEDQALASNFVKQLALRFVFSPSGAGDPNNASACAGPYETTGTKAIIKQAKGSESEGIVDIGKFYCYRVVTTPAYKLQFAAPKPDGTCEMPTAAWSDVNNPLITYFVNSDATLRLPRPRTMVPADESLARCRANGVSKERCFRSN